MCRKPLPDSQSRFITGQEPDLHMNWQVSGTTCLVVAQAVNKLSLYITALLTEANTPRKLQALGRESCQGEVTHSHPFKSLAGSYCRMITKLKCTHRAVKGAGQQYLPSGLSFSLRSLRSTSSMLCLQRASFSSSPSI